MTCLIDEGGNHPQILNSTEFCSVEADSLIEWAKCVTGQTWNEAYVFFKHNESENGGCGA